MIAKTVVDVILGEAKAGSYEDMLAIASVISNRANGGQTSWDDVALRASEFNAYNKPLPSGVDKYRAEAQRAIDQVKKSGPVHNATFYATPKAQGNLPKGLSKVTSTDGHIYFTDPQKRPIYTASGLKKIDYSSLSTPAPQMSFNDAGLPTGLDVPLPKGYDTPTAQASSPFDAIINEQAKPRGLAVLTQKTDQNNFEAQRQEPKTDGLLGYLTADKDPSHVTGLDDDYKSRLEPFLRHNGNTKIFSGFRSNEHQARLFDAAVKKYGSPQAARKWVAPPGKSNHNAKAGEGGKATDLRYGSAAARQKAHKEAESFGLTFRMGHEPWHIEPIKDWNRQVNSEYGKTPANPPKPSFRNESQTYAAPMGNVERGGNLPAPIDQNTNLYGASPSDYANYQSSNRSSALPRGDVAPKPSFRPQVSQQENRGSLSTSMRGAPSRTQPRTDAMPVSMPAPKPAYQPKASDYSNYMMQAPVKTQPEYAPKASDYANYMMGAPAPAPQLPQTTIAGPIGQPMAGIPIPAPRPTKIDRFKQKAGSKLKQHFKPQTVAARMAGGLIGGPLGVMAGPKIAQFINQRGFKGNGFSMPKFGNKQPLNQFQSRGNNSSNRMQNAMSGPRGATNTASNGSQATSLGNGQYTYYSPKSGKTSVKGEINMNKSADLRSFFGN